MGRERLPDSGRKSNHPLEDHPMLLEHNKFVVKSQSKTLSSKKSYQILDAESGQVLATAQDTTGFLPGLLGATTIEVRDASNNAPVFSVGRYGWLMKKDQVVDPQGKVVGRYKSKMFSLSGGFNVYDNDGKHLAEIQGKMLKSEYKFVTPDRSADMGSVSKTWGGLAKSLLSGDDTFGVQIDPKYAKDDAAKMIILGATIAVESIFKKKAESGGGGGEGGGGGGGDE
jgi:uncharacterized protein YxjI